MAELKTKRTNASVAAALYHACRTATAHVTPRTGTWDIMVRGTWDMGNDKSCSLEPLEYEEGTKMLSTHREMLTGCSRLACVALLCAAGVLLVASPGIAQMTTVPKTASVVVMDAWIREAAATQAATGAYATLENPTAKPVILVSVDVEGAGIVELHDTKMVGEMMSMVKVPSIEVPAHGRAELRPGGRHIMVFQLKQAYEPGGMVTFTFRFADGTSTVVRAEIRRKAAMGK